MIDRFRKEKKYVDELELLVEEISDGSTADDRYIQSELQLMVNTWLSRMPQKRRAIFLLRYHEDKTVKEIADLLGISTKTVQNQLLNTTNTLKHLPLCLNKTKPNDFQLVLLFFVVKGND